jgi:hypothetical protein
MDSVQDASPAAGMVDFGSLGTQLDPDIYEKHRSAITQMVQKLLDDLDGYSNKHGVTNAEVIAIASMSTPRSVQ